MNNAVKKQKHKAKKRTASSSVTAAAVVGVGALAFSSGVCVSAARTSIRRAGVDGFEGVDALVPSQATSGAGLGEVRADAVSRRWLLADASAPTMTRRGVAAALAALEAAGEPLSLSSSLRVKGTTTKGSWRSGTGSGLGDAAACRFRSLRSHWEGGGVVGVEGGRQIPRSDTGKPRNAASSLQIVAPPSPPCRAHLCHRLVHQRLKVLQPLLHRGRPLERLVGRGGRRGGGVGRRAGQVGKRRLEGGKGRCMCV